MTEALQSEPTFVPSWTAEETTYKLAAITPDWWVYLGPDDEDWHKWVLEQLPHSHGCEWVCEGFVSEGFVMRVDLHRVVTKPLLTVVA